MPKNTIYSKKQILLNLTFASYQLEKVKYSLYDK